MEAYLDAVDLWEAVEDDYDIPLILDNPTMAQVKNHKERKTRKSKAKACLFAAISATIFTRIMSLKSAKVIWSYLKFEYEGDDRIKGMKAQEQWMVMRQEATVDEALPAKHEDGWRNKKKKNRKHQQANGEAAVHRSNKNKAGSSKGKYPPCKHCDRTSHSPFKCWKRPDAKCNKCNQLGHEAIICKNQNQQQDTDAQIANEDENDHLFVVTCFLGSISSDSWLIDSGCTNHMTHDKELFKELKPTRIARVWISHGGHIPTKGIGTVAIATHLGTKVIDDVLYVPEIVV
ncbi:retrovirus-related Pol polyprotein from transposon RE1 [Vitis vinifera]|uniref:retrovirus-related Pol polyprotein from transposon RE1 n=1 Tax=Vitis vinifera TaxID=29760 RepID=UPI00053F3FFD|nr:retrovirus-related Pol polyprotein from transposon RE1 [Vitis vinifera]|eukprot:XP_010658657.1 PREDICTED: uncharacterized protein LOC100854523 [Vitis vinifera]